MFWMTKKDRRIEYLELKLKNTESEYHGEMLKNTFLRNRIRELEDENKELSFRPVDKPVQSNIDLQSPLFQRIIKAGRNALIKKAHPDHGGTREELEEIQEAFEILKTVKLSYKSSLEDDARRQRDALHRYMAAQQNMYGSFWR